MRIIGVMSGTSLDGIDAALVRFEGTRVPPAWTLEAFRTTPYEADRRERIHSVIADGDARSLCTLHADLGEWFAEAVLALCAETGIAPGDVACIGSHGQTVWHEPATESRRGSTLQLGCAATLAERTGISVVSDFRSRDIAAGGQGAPLVPFADRMLFAVDDRTRVLLNIGGMANLTRVPPRGRNSPLLAFDTGPGNALIDAAVELASDGHEAFDRDGARAAAGTVIEPLLREMLESPWFDVAPPKSTGRETFGRGYVNALAERIRPRDERAWADLIATLTAFSAHSITSAIRRWVLPLGADEIVVTGGGASNPVLLGMLRAGVEPVPVVPGRDAGIDPDAKEAIAFAALAWAHLAGVPGNVPEATGASGARILGSRTPA